MAAESIPDQMAEAWIGAGGWGYFRGPAGPGLPDYARAFGFVEVNTTFYRHPTIGAARRWRAAVPAGFQFAVKAHRDITHTERLRATRRALSAISRDVAIAKALGTDLLILQAPPDLRIGREEAAGLRDFGALLGSRSRIGLEARAHGGRTLPTPAAKALQDIGGFDVVDLSQSQRPRTKSDVLYTRLFGKGEHNLWEFSDDELREIRDAGDRVGGDRMVFTFHGVRMYKDAARFATYEATGRFVPATRSTGLEAVREILAPDVRLPASRDALLRDHGWKVVTLEDGRNVHASDLLAALPRGTYRSVEEVLQSLVF